MPPHHLLIDGQRVAGAATLEVINPATGAPFAEAPRASHAQLEAAVAAAARAFPGWARTPQAGRRAALEALADAMAARAEDFARLLTLEQGKPLAEARGEVEGTLAALRWFAGQALPRRLLRETAAERLTEQRTPLGVVAAITPWNFPLILLAIKLAPALITGNVVIAKPAPTTPLTTLLLGEVAADVLPAGVFQTLVDAHDLGDALTGHRDVAQVAFTGSTATGRKVMASIAPGLKRFTLELGGNDPAIVLDDADVGALAPRLFAAATYNAGQVCLAAKRLYVPRRLAGALCEALVAEAAKAVVGDGLAPETQIGPIQNAAQFAKLQGYLAEAHAHGTVIAGGAVLDRPGYFIAPTLVRDLPAEARLIHEEQFGPILPIITYDTDDEAIHAANATPYGLGASVWTSDVARGEAMAARIEAGTVWVNRHLDLPFDIAFGGAKQSGLGRQQGLAGLEEFTQAKVISTSLGGAG